jgi:hypothetical protein
MSSLEYRARPSLRQPLLIAAWSGWSDAGEAASSAARFMHRRWRSEVVAEIDSEEFYDFTQSRPQVRLERGERVIDWPANTFSAKRLDHLDRDVIVFRGTEPHLNWRTYSELFIEVCRTFEVSAVLMLGALLAEVSHARAVRVSGSATDPLLSTPLRLGEQRRPGYQGPTGILGVTSRALQDAEIISGSLWANMPFYVQRSPNPKGSLALLERLNGGFDFKLSLHDLEVFAARFEAQVASDIESNPEVAEYARRVAELSDDEDDEDDDVPPGDEQDELPDAASMVDELERFLRGQQHRDDET